MSEIAVIIPAYNAAATVERTIRSVLASSIPIEVWAVDDGSTDDTGEILDSLAEEFSALTVLHKKNNGAYQARLYALKRISTPYFGFVDADDTVDSTMFERMLTLAKQEHLDVVQVNGGTGILTDEQIFRKVVKPVMWEGRSSSFIWDKLYRHQYEFDAFESTNGITNFDDLIFNLQFFRSVKRLGFINDNLYQYNATVGSAARKFRWRTVRDFMETFRLRRKFAKDYHLWAWGYCNLRWFIKNLRNLAVIYLKGVGK